MERFGASIRKAYAVINLSRVVYLYKSNARDNSALVILMKETIHALITATGAFT